MFVLLRPLHCLGFTSLQISGNVHPQLVTGSSQSTWTSCFRTKHHTRKLHRTSPPAGIRTSDLLWGHPHLECLLLVPSKAACCSLLCWSDQIVPHTATGTCLQMFLGDDIMWLCRMPHCDWFSESLQEYLPDNDQMLFSLSSDSVSLLLLCLYFMQLCRKKHCWSRLKRRNSSRNEETAVA